jgi:hypothetical protein
MTKALSPIAQAVEPRRAASIDRARESALRYVEAVRARLVEAGMDFDAAFPRPTTGMGRVAYRQAQSVRDNAIRLCRVLISTRRPGQPLPVEISDEGVARFVAQIEADASADFDAYVAKLESKVGETVEASIDGASLWIGSVLTVRTIAGAVERWSTKQIVNVSVLGTLFNQWPTRRMA